MRQHLADVLMKSPATTVIITAMAEDDATPGASDRVHGLGSSESDQW
jgi:hypothetical protein